QALLPPRLCRRAGTPSIGASGRSHDLVANDVVGEGQDPVEVVYRFRAGREFDHGVEAFVDVVDLVGEAALAPQIRGLDLGAPAGEERLDFLRLGLDVRLGQLGPMDGHDFVDAQCVTSCGHPFWKAPPVSSRWSRGAAAPAARRGRCRSPAIVTGSGSWPK